MTRRSTECGFSIIEVLFVLFFMSILTGFAAFSYFELENNLAYSASQVVGFIKKTRSKALSTTYFYQLTAETASRIKVTRGTSCDGDDLTEDAQSSFTLPDEVLITDITWQICFTPRGITTDSGTISLKDNEGKSKQIEIAVGGGIRIVNT